MFLRPALSVWVIANVTAILFLCIRKDSIELKEKTATCKQRSMKNVYFQKRMEPFVCLQFEFHSFNWRLIDDGQFWNANYWKNIIWTNCLCVSLMHMRLNDRTDQTHPKCISHVYIRAQGVRRWSRFFFFSLFLFFLRVHTPLHLMLYNFRFKCFFIPLSSGENHFMFVFHFTLHFIRNWWGCPKR